MMYFKVGIDSATSWPSGRSNIAIRTCNNYGLVARCYSCWATKLMKHSTNCMGCLKCDLLMLFNCLVSTHSC